MRLGFGEARGEVLMILDADLTVQPEDLPRFLEALVEDKGEFINGVRLVYPMDGRSMAFFNLVELSEEYFLHNSSIGPIHHEAQAPLKEVIRSLVGG